MTEAALQNRFKDILARICQPGRLVGNESGSGPGFSDAASEVRVVLAFPDVYEIGISNQAIQILYHLARTNAGVGVERAYLPWVDAIEEMRREQIPLLTLETWSPVASADLLGITLQHEFNYTNVLEMLALAGIPLVAAERAEEHPIVMGGGPAAANFLPMSPFLDAVVVGDGEEVVPEILEILVESKRDGLLRGEIKVRLARLEGVYVPGVSSEVRRRVIARLEDAVYPASCLVPLATGVHDRAWVEVMRGCSRGCRFCQAGMWYRPVRERSPRQVGEMVDNQLEATGHEELALASLSTTDYSGLTTALTDIARVHPDTKISLPSLRVDSASIRLAHLVSPTGPSLTLAPEVGDQRMWDIVNKNVTEADVISAAQEAFRCGYKTLKMYFMIGLPLEKDEDVVAIADLCLRVREVAREVLGSEAGRVQLSVSVNNFVPKPLTPFQWAGMADRATIRCRQEILRARLKKRGIKLALHDVDKSYLEATLARGGVEMAAVIRGAWERGARFDSWTEQFRPSAWREALALIGTTAEASATTETALDAELPWGVIRGTVDAGFLRAEWERATRGETTPDCRGGACSACGVCEVNVAVDLAGAPAKGDDGIIIALAAEASESQCPTAEPSGGGRYLLTFAVGGKMRFIGHLDKMEIFRRAVRRAGGRLALSAGMRPKPLLSLALPLAVGMEADAEMCEFELAAPPPADFERRLQRVLPAGLSIVSVAPYEGRRHVAARVTGVEYELQVEVSPAAEGRGDGLCPTLEAAAKAFAAAPSLVIREQRKDRVRELDVKAYVSQVDVRAAGPRSALVRFEVAVTPGGSARPERVVEVLGGLAGVELHVCTGRRTRIILA